ncbi:hypothetical protein [Yersinia wautersii]|uniref:hypothetical protein n=1 Tax=Yersinia wautersii TaxID=1341643 RepID=UPI00040BE22A|nr:hypothetical protein [Yersinia wautersii]
MKVRYRVKAKDCLKKALEELEHQDDRHLKYVALELRMCIEALIYDKLQSYKDEAPINTYETWQPKKILEELLIIDPFADSSSSLSFSLEDKFGNPTEWTHLGEERMLTLKEIKKHYNYLGSFLHIQTIKQISEGKEINYKSLREKLNQIVSMIKDSLNAKLYNSNFCYSANIDCKRCNEKIKRRVPYTENYKFKTKCSHCNAPYEVTTLPEKKVCWVSLKTSTDCMNQECKTEFDIWNDKLFPDSKIKCPKCDELYIIKMSLFLDDSHN